MTIFLDYYLEDGKITTVSTMTDRKNISTYMKNTFSKLTGDLAGIEPVVVFQRPIIHIYNALEGFEHLLDDNDLRKRWQDLHTIIRKEIDKTIALSKIAKSTLGLGPQSKINRLEKRVGPRDQVEIEIQMNERLEVLKQVYDYAVQRGQISFEKRDETIWVELNIDENPIHSGL